MPWEIFLRFFCTVKNLKNITLVFSVFKKTQGTRESAGISRNQEGNPTPCQPDLRGKSELIGKTFLGNDEKNITHIDAIFFEHTVDTLTIAMEWFT